MQIKVAIVTLVFKQGSRNLKDNYRPISILAVASKVFEKLICKQPSNHFDNIFSKFQCGFIKVFGAQNSFLLIVRSLAPFLLTYQKLLIAFIMIY